MSSSLEQKQILKMVEDGKINAQEALKLIQVLKSPSIEGEIISAAASPFGLGAGPAGHYPHDFEEIAGNARRLWEILLWIGVSVVVLSAYWLYSLVVASNYGFWFYCALVPFLFSILLLTLFTSGRNSRWLYVNVEQPQNEWPRNITLGLPLPLGLAGWFLRNFGDSIEGLNQAAADEILEFLSNGFSSKEPVIVNVNEDYGGERVQVYIG
jgi:hypothetical protein